MKRFYRVGNITTEQGLWYDFEGNFTGLIHNKFNFCKNHALPMPFDENVIGYLSATDDYETLFFWFTKEDIVELQKYGYQISVYESDDYKFHDNHWLINQKTSIIVDTIII